MLRSARYWDGMRGGMASERRSYIEGAGFGFAAVAIWASWSAVTRLAVTTNLDAWDIAALRFGVAGLVLFPYLLKRGLALDRLGWSGLAILVAGGGVPYVFAAAAGLQFAPAHDQGALNPGFMPLFVALLAGLFLRESHDAVQKLGLLAIAIGAIVIVWLHARDGGTGWSGSRTFGHALFLLASFLWACFTIVMRRARLDAMHAAALVATGSLTLYLPVYLLLHGTRLLEIPLDDLAIQAGFQGILVTIVSLLLYGRSVEILGASGGAAFGALVPALTALIAIPLLGEWPSRPDWLGIGLISAGVYLASGGPFFGRTASG